MKKLTFSILIVMLSTLLIAQESALSENDTTVTSSTIQFDAESAGRMTKWIDINKDSKHKYIIEEEDGYYFYLYDFGCSRAEIFDEKYFIKVYMGKTKDDALSSKKMIKQWCKKAKRNDYITVTNPNGQKVMLFKGTPGILYMSYGDIEDIQACLQMHKIESNAMANVIPFVGLVNSGNTVRQRDERDTSVRGKIKEGTYHPTNCIEILDLDRAANALKSNMKRICHGEP